MNKRLFISIARRFVRQIRWIKRRWYLQKCYWGVFLTGGIIEISDNVSISVPVRCDGPGQVTVGSKSSLGYLLAPMLGKGEILLQSRTPQARITIGSGCHFSNNVSLVACREITIGADCLLGDFVTIFDSDFHNIDPAQRHLSCGQSLPVRIGNNVWIGSRAMVLKGVTIGDNSVIAPMAVVTRDVPANIVVAGIPAKKVKDIA